MTVIDFLRLTRRSWRTLVIAVVAGVLLMVAYTAITPKVYEASSTGFIASDSGGVISGSQSAMDKVAAYLPLISSAPVFEKIRADPTVELGGDNLEGRLSANIVGGTTMIVVSATAPTPESALALANGGLNALTAVIGDIETAATPGQAPELRVVPLQNAGLPTTPISPKPKTNLLLGLGGGLVLGYLIVFLRRALETRIRSSEELTEIMGVGLFGSMPKVTDGSPSLDATDREGTLAAEAIRQVRTALSFSSVDRRVQCVAITSANQGEGKTTVATQLAQVFARSGREVVIIDADLRRPAVADTLAVDGSIGLSELLSGQASFADVIQRSDEEGLYILPAGQTPPNPSEMLGSETFRNLLDALSEDYFVIVDAPPVLPVTDASIIATVVDGIVFIAVAGGTKKPEIVAAHRMLTQVHGHILGTVLNMVPLRGADSTSYGYYGSKYGYYTADNERPARSRGGLRSRARSTRSRSSRHGRRRSR